MPNLPFARVALYAPPDLIARFKAAASDRGMNLSAWLVQAALSYAASHQRNTKGKYKADKRRALTSYGYPLDGKCFICKQACHSEGPLEAHYGSSITMTLKQSELDYGFTHPCDEEN